MVSFKVRVAENNYELSVQQDLTIWDAKVMLQEKNPESGLLANFSRWVFKGKVLADSATIAICGLADGDCVIAVKTKVASSERLPGGGATIGATPSSPTGNATATPQLPTAHSRAPTAFDAAMHELLAHNEDVSQVKACVATLATICANIVRNPAEAKYRRVPAANKSFQTKVGSLRGGSSAMAALGFTAEGAAGDWVLVPSAARWDVLTACYDKLLKFQMRLTAAPAAPITAGTGDGATASNISTDTDKEPEPAAKVSADDGTASQEEAARLMLAALALAANAPSSPSKVTSEEGAATSSAGTENGTEKE